jgi:small-conductance mechanosensitive channel
VRSKGYLQGNGYVVTWAIGHLVFLVQPHEINLEWRQWRFDRLPILPTEWPLVVYEKTSDQFEVVRKILTSGRVSEVVCATDAGREGKLIFRYIYEAAGCRKPVSRLCISSLTPEAIRKGFDELRPGSGLADAASDHSKANWIVGMNLSRASPYLHICCQTTYMANELSAPISKISARSNALSKTRSIFLLALVTLLILCLVFVWTTRDAMAHLQFLRAQNGSVSSAGGKNTLVDLGPWRTIQAIEPLATTAEEKEYAHDAERLADHEVDQAFALALRLASLQAQRRVYTEETLALLEKVAQLKQVVQQDQKQVDLLTAQASADSGKNGVPSTDNNDDLEVAKAQLGLDSDELADAQQELERTSGDNSAKIKEELAAHEAATHQDGNKSDGDGQIAILSAKQHRTLAARVLSWFNQIDRYKLIQQALQQTQSDIATLTYQQKALEAKTKVPPVAAPKDAIDHTAWLASVKDRSVQRQMLGIYDDRIQTEQQLASVYGKWSSQVLLQHRIVLHLILQSLAWIFLIAIGMILGDILARHVTALPALDRRQSQTLRRVLELSVQLLGIGLILLIIFGYPQQTPTIIGLATAALTIALQDFILAFLGWFVLVGKNGIHVGDNIEINGVNGEVSEIGLFSTTIFETGKAPDTGHLTGRRITFINSFAIRGQYFNFSTAGQWMWDEVSVSVPATEDIHTVAEKVHKAVLEETEKNARMAKEELERGAHGESLQSLNTESVLSLRPTSTGIEIEVRYITRAAERTDVRNRLYQHLIDLLHA